MVTSHAPPSGDLACNPGMCPNWELNQRLFGLQVVAQSTEPCHLGLFCYFKYDVSWCGSLWFHLVGGSFCVLAL